MIQQQIDVALGYRSYTIYAGSDMSSSFAPMCRQHGISDAVVVITDQNVARYYLKPMLRNLVEQKFQPLTIKIPAGETQKSMNSTNAILTKMLKERVPRNACVIALGGGVIGDLAGFVAAIYQRGIKLVQVPTTLLSQVDSSIGGKVGVNHKLGKNMIGAFHQPVFVWTDIDCLKTLPLREMVCGMGEVVKYGIIRSAELFGFIDSHLDEILGLNREALINIQTQCAKIKAEVVSLDEKESGVRIILNCGHTIGHGLEAAGRYTLLKHGEAVLLGLVAESYISKEMGLLDAASYERILSLINRIPMKAKLSSLKISDVIKAISLDKKRISKKLRFVLPTTIGSVKVVEDVEPKLIQAVVKKIIKGK
jgi:3-dehydroquinate synthase